MLRINLGSGQRKFGPGWTNVDVQDKWSPDVVASGDNLPFEDNSAEMIVMHHVLEHFGCGEADGVMNECRRVLVPGGSLVVTVPDIHALYCAHHNGAIDDFQLMVNLYGAYMGDPADRHKWGYTRTGLGTYLHKFFKGVQLFDFRPIPGADIATDWWILGVEAIK